MGFRTGGCAGGWGWEGAGVGVGGRRHGRGWDTCCTTEMQGVCSRFANGPAATQMPAADKKSGHAGACFCGVSGLTLITPAVWNSGSPASCAAAAAAPLQLRWNAADRSLQDCAPSCMPPPPASRGCQKVHTPPCVAVALLSRQKCARRQRCPAHFLVQQAPGAGPLACRSRTPVPALALLA